MFTDLSKNSTCFYWNLYFFYETTNQMYHDVHCDHYQEDYHKRMLNLIHVQILWNQLGFLGTENIVLYYCYYLQCVVAVAMTMMNLFLEAPRWVNRNPADPDLDIYELFLFFCSFCLFLFLFLFQNKNDKEKDILQLEIINDIMWDLT